MKDDSDATLVGRDCYGEPVLYSYSNIPCFDSGDRQFDSLRGWFLVKDKRELHFITFSRGTMIGSITVFPKLVEAEVGARAPLEAVYREDCASKSDALKRECAIKRLTREKKLALIGAGE